jgi:hypothetical protein
MSFPLGGINASGRRERNLTIVQNLRCGEGGATCGRRFGTLIVARGPRSLRLREPRANCGLTQQLCWPNQPCIFLPGGLVSLPSAGQGRCGYRENANRRRHNKFRNWCWVLAPDVVAGRLERNEDLRLVFNGGVLRGALIGRPVGDSHDPKFFPIFAPIFSWWRSGRARNGRSHFSMRRK